MMAIYTRFGSKVTLVGKADKDGWITVRYEDGLEQERHVSELRPDREDMDAFNEALALVEG